MGLGIGVQSNYSAYLADQSIGRCNSQLDLLDIVTARQLQLGQNSRVVRKLDHSARRAVALLRHPNTGGARSQLVSRFDVAASGDSGQARILHKLTGMVTDLGSSGGSSRFNRRARSSSGSLGWLSSSLGRLGGTFRRNGGGHRFHTRLNLQGHLDWASVASLDEVNTNACGVNVAREVHWEIINVVDLKKE